MYDQFGTLHRARRQKASDVHVLSHLSLVQALGQSAEGDGGEVVLEFSDPVRFGQFGSMVKDTLKNGMPAGVYRTSSLEVNVPEISMRFTQISDRTEKSVQSRLNYSAEASAAAASAAATFLASSFSTAFIMTDGAVSACFVLTVR